MKTGKKFKKFLSVIVAGSAFIMPSAVIKEVNVNTVIDAAAVGTADNRIETGLEYGGSWFEGDGYAVSRYMNTFTMNADGSSVFECASAQGMPRIINFAGSAYKDGVYYLSDGTFQDGNSGTESGVTGTVTVNDDRSISFSSSTYLSDEYMVLVDGIPSESDVTAEVLPEDTAITVPDVNCTWYLEPSIECDFIIPINDSYPTLYTEGVSAFKSGGNFYNKFSVISKNGKYGVIGYDGNLITDINYRTVEVGWGESTYNDDTGKWNCQGNTIMLQDDDYKSHALSEDGVISDEGDFIEVTNGYPTIAYVDGENRAAITGMNLDSQTVDVSGTSLLLHEGSYETYDSYKYVVSDYTKPYALISNGKRMTDYIYEGRGNYSCGLIAAKSGGKWGYLNSQGDVVIPFEYDDIEDTKYDRETTYNETLNYQIYDATENYVVLCKDGAYSLYTTDYNEVIPFGMFERICPVYNNLAWVKDRTTGLWGVIDVNATINNISSENNDISGISDIETDTEETITEDTSVTESVSVSTSAGETDSDNKPEVNRGLVIFIMAAVLVVGSATIIIILKRNKSAE